MKREIKVIQNTKIFENSRNLKVAKYDSLKIAKSTCRENFMQ